MEHLNRISCSFLSFLNVVGEKESSEKRALSFTEDVFPQEQRMYFRRNRGRSEKELSLPCVACSFHLRPDQGEIDPAISISP